MKKLIFLYLFILSSFVAVQAQINYEFTNNSNYDWTYTVLDLNGTLHVVDIPANESESGTYIDAVAFNVPWQASNSLGCGTGGVHTGPIGFTPVFLGFCPVAAGLTYQILGINPSTLTVNFF